MVLLHAVAVALCNSMCATQGSSDKMVQMSLLN